MPAGDNCSPWKAVAPIACDVSESICRLFSLPLKRLTEGVSSSTDHVGLWVRLDVCLR